MTAQRTVCPSSFGCVKKHASVVFRLYFAPAYTRNAYGRPLSRGPKAECASAVNSRRTNRTSTSRANLLQRLASTRIHTKPWWFSHSIRFTPRRRHLRGNNATKYRSPMSSQQIDAGSYPEYRHSQCRATHGSQNPFVKSVHLPPIVMDLPKVSEICPSFVTF